MKILKSQLRKIIKEEIGQSQRDLAHMLGRQTRSKKTYGGKDDYSILPEAILDAAIEGIMDNGDSTLKNWGYEDFFIDKHRRPSPSKRSSMEIALNTPWGLKYFSVTITPSKKNTNRP